MTLLPQPVVAAPLQVSLLLGDGTTRQVLDELAGVGDAYPALREADIRAFGGAPLDVAARRHVAGSRVVVIQLVGRRILDDMREELAAARAGGARLFGFGGNDEAEYAALGIERPASLREYFESGGAVNVRNGLLHALSLAGLPVEAGPPRPVPDSGLYETSTRAWFEDFASFRQACRRCVDGRPWVGFVVYRSDVAAGTTAHIDALVAALERRGFNVLPVFGYPPEEPVRRFLFDERGTPRVEAVVAAAMKIGVDADRLSPVLARLDAPVINAISLFAGSAADWEASPVGMDIMERSWQLAMPELGGMTQPTVFAAKEVLRHPGTGATYVEQQPIPERVERLADRVGRWVELRRKPNAEKRVLLQYFNFPPGREGVGASYLNVLPDSLWRVLRRLVQEGYDVSGMPADPATLQSEVLRYGANIPAHDAAGVAALAQSGRAVLLPLATYERWFAGLPAAAREQVVASWGEPADATAMTWTDAAGRRHFVLPVLRYGNVLLAPQPSRGKTDEPEKLYHDMYFPPPHQYIAFYLWLHEQGRVDAMFQFGTHGTHEWLPGREAGLGPADAPEYLVRDLPNLYAFIVDNVGEASIAMRRGMATMIGHLTPPLDQAVLNPELRAIEGLLDDYKRARQQSLLLASAHIEAVRQAVIDLGIVAELDLEGPPEEVGDEALADAVHDYLEELSGRVTPLGLHTFGVEPRPALLEATASTIVAAEGPADQVARETRLEEVRAQLRESALRELDALVAGLSGRYILAGPGGDPLRTPAALPTGRNFYSFDPRRMPGPASYALGERLGRELLEGHRARHGEYPARVAFTLWGVETMRHEGVQESQILSLLGVRPLYDARGVVRGLEPIPRESLGRPRVDVTVIPSGLYRDLFPNLVVLLDEAAALAQAQEEPDNAPRRNLLALTRQLEDQGVPAELASRLAGVRLFSVPPGAYGTNVEAAVDRSDTWEDEGEIAAMYFRRMGHLYGRGFWGDAGVDEAAGGDVLRRALAGTRMTVHARSSNVYQVLDGDDPFASFGGLTLAVRSVEGASPEVMISNLANVAQARQETLARFMGRELRSRYLNPQWIEAMQQEGYAGAKFINQVVQNLWGWQVTVPEAVDDAKWREMHATYVADRYDLGIEESFRQSDNREAYRAMMARMLEAVRKGYWSADAETVADLGQRVAALNAELDDGCASGGCADPLLDVLSRAGLVPAPSVPAAPQPAPGVPGQAAQSAVSVALAPPAAAAVPADAAPAAETVRGFLMETVAPPAATAAEPTPLWAQLITLLALLFAFALGFWRGYPAPAVMPGRLRSGRGDRI